MSSATPNSLGYLNGATVNSSSGSPGSGISFSPIPATFRVSNIQISGSNGQYSQIAAVLFPDELDPAPLLTLNAYPAGPRAARSARRVRIGNWATWPSWR
jgi:hypothetical protein